MEGYSLVCEAFSLDLCISSTSIAGHQFASRSLSSSFSVRYLPGFIDIPANESITLAIMLLDGLLWSWTRHCHISRRSIAARDLLYVAYCDPVTIVLARRLQISYMHLHIPQRPRHRMQPSLIAHPPKSLATDEISWIDFTYPMIFARLMSKSPPVLTTCGADSLIIRSDTRLSVCIC